MIKIAFNKKTFKKKKKPNPEISLRFMLHLTPGFLLQCITQAKSSARFIVHVSKVKYISVVSVESKKKK